MAFLTTSQKWTRCSKACVSQGKLHMFLAAAKGHRPLAVTKMKMAATPLHRALHTVVAARGAPAALALAAPAAAQSRSPGAQQCVQCSPT
jgi:hypothetical protein